MSTTDTCVVFCGEFTRDSGGSLRIRIMQLFLCADLLHCTEIQFHSIADSSLTRRCLLLATNHDLRRSSLVGATISEISPRNMATVCFRPSEISDEEYNEFYKSFSKDGDAPMTRTHFTAEGEVRAPRALHAGSYFSLCLHIAMQTYLQSTSQHKRFSCYCVPAAETFRMI